jgi:hypothetical protein
LSARTTAELLEAWRKAQRASDAARRASEIANEASIAAAEAAAAARRAAEAAGLTLDATDTATAAAKDAYSEREHQVSTAGEGGTQPEA